MIMSFHRTPSGFVELLSVWGHGKGTPANAHRPATLITDDGDGHYQQWKYTGQLDDALVTLARLEKFITGNYDAHVAVRSGAGYIVQPAPVDFWIERDGEFVPNLAAYPDVIAF
jgi:hypothetical protein